MTIYDIDQRIAALVDPGTGELLDYEAFAALTMERDAKIENIALWAKDSDGEALLIKKEIDTLTERKRAAERRSERLRGYLAKILQGEKFSTSRCVVSFRKTARCVPDDGFIQWAQEHGRDDLLKYKPPEISLTAVKEALKAGDNIPAHMEAGLSVGVK